MLYLPRDTPRVLYFSYTQARQCFRCYIVLPGRVRVGAIFSLKPLRFSVIRISNQKQPSCKKRSAALEKAMVKKDCEIQGGGQEMAGMVG